MTRTERRGGGILRCLTFAAALISGAVPGHAREGDLPHIATQQGRHALMVDGTGKRLAKRDGAPTLAALRDQGRSPAEVRAMAGFPV